MTTKPSRKSSTGAPGAKLLISVSALAASLSGWAALAYKNQLEPAPATLAALPPAQVAQQQPEPVYIAMELPALPTIIPPPALPTPKPTGIPTKVQVVYVPPAPAAQNPDPAAGLRVVNAPPPPPSGGSQGQSQPSNQQSASSRANNAPPPVTTTKSSG